MRLKKYYLNEKTKIDIYEISYEIKEDEILLKKIKEFAQRTANNTYRRSRMNSKEHLKNIIIGKMAEEAFYFLCNKIGIEEISEVNYDNKIDDYDFLLKNAVTIDIKSSSLMTKKKQYSLKEAIEYFNFMVLKDQKKQDIVIQVLYPNRNNFLNFFFSNFEFVDEIQKRGKHKKIKMNGGYGDYTLLHIIDGKNLIEIRKI